jgi:hypothetical protein
MRLSVEELAEALSNFVNGASSDQAEKLAKLMANDHPTLQQSKMRLACLFIEEMADKSYVDGRNETSQKTAKAMIKGFKQMSKDDIIREDGVISTGLQKYIEEVALPSKSLPTI